MSELATITRHAERGMITLRADLSDGTVGEAVRAATGHAIPAAGKIAGDGTKGVLWMSPDELLIMVPYDTVDAALEQIVTALSGVHHLAVNVSDARAVFTVAGDDAREVLARLCPVDLHAQSFGVGDFRRTRLAQVPAAFWQHETGFDVVCFRSVGDYAEGVLRRSAQGTPTGALG
ncbi:sarcosine oxidase subunit gamma [Thalassorhabdomicrobium marinisediminis]|uniref:Sarcosine oxidase subunit gamma n=1 Tax=Thalassorhabdomicrobium marinisediminis TaxID=2170577 RepID=A0A2T7G164_9RHOB|nr:sarcosine oxidase subunit gamma family protein [Thalassorhabdomicrobium marinisediminis]PVA08173.1 sarcosine oxidase subunit gamma [Thalassorhabdomicrobium marinisediminis]